MSTNYEVWLNARHLVRLLRTLQFDAEGAADRRALMRAAS